MLVGSFFYQFGSSPCPEIVLFDEVWISDRQSWARRFVPLPMGKWVLIGLDER